MKRNTRFVSLFLALLMVSGGLLSCAGDTKETTAQTTDTTTAVTETIDNSTDENGYLKDDLPELDFGGETVNLLYWSDVENQEFEAEEMTGELVNDAIYQRNASTEDRLGITYNWIGTPGNGGNIDAYVGKVRESQMAGDAAYDILASYSRSIAACMVNGFLTNLESAAYLDYEKPWWPDNLLEESMINDRLYFVSGDISTNALHMMYCVYFNKQLLLDYNLENPQDLVLADQWTLDKLIEMSSDVYQDTNGNAKKDVEDFFGLVLTSFHNDAFYTGSDLKLVEKDDEKVLKISDDFYSEKTVDLLLKLSAWENTDDVFNNDSYEQAFTDNHALFIVNRAHYASKALRTADISYGIVPVPKYDEDQQNYRTVMGNPVTLYGVSMSCQKKDVCTAVLECMGSYGYRLTTPAIFENNMKVRYSDDDVNAQMYDIVRESISFELGRFLNKYLADITDIFFQQITNTSPNWASTVEKKRESLTKKMESVVEDVIANEAYLG